MEWDDIRAAVEWKNQRCLERFGAQSMFDATLAPWRVDRVTKLRDASVSDLAVDDQIDREIVCTQRIRADLQHVPWYAKRARAAREEGDEWSYWRSLYWAAPNGVRMTPDELNALVAWRARRQRERQAHAPMARDNMSGKVLVQPPFEAIVAEYSERFGQKTEAVTGVAKARGRCAYLGDLMLRAIESGEELQTLEVAQYMLSRPAALDAAPTAEDLRDYWRGLSVLTLQRQGHSK